MGLNPSIGYCVRKRLTEMPFDEYVKAHDRFLEHYPEVVRQELDEGLERAAKSTERRLKYGMKSHDGSMREADPLDIMECYVLACRSSLLQAANDIVVKEYDLRMSSQLGQELEWAVYDEGLLRAAFDEYYRDRVPEDVRKEYEAECAAYGMSEDVALDMADNGSRTYEPDPYPGKSMQDMLDYLDETNYMYSWQFDHDIQHPNENSRWKKERAMRRHQNILKEQQRRERAKAKKKRRFGFF